MVRRSNICRRDSRGSCACSASDGSSDDGWGECSVRRRRNSGENLWCRRKCGIVVPVESPEEPKPKPEMKDEGVLTEVFGPPEQLQRAQSAKSLGRKSKVDLAQMRKSRASQAAIYTETTTTDDTTDSSPKLSKKKLKGLLKRKSMVGSEKLRKLKGTSSAEAQKSMVVPAASRMSTVSKKSKKSVKGDAQQAGKMSTVSKKARMSTASKKTVVEPAQSETEVAPAVQGRKSILSRKDVGEGRKSTVSRKEPGDGRKSTVSKKESRKSTVSKRIVNEAVLEDRKSVMSKKPPDPRKSTASKRDPLAFDERKSTMSKKLPVSRKSTASKRGLEAERKSNFVTERKSNFIADAPTVDNRMSATSKRDIGDEPPRALSVAPARKSRKSTKSTASKRLQSVANVGLDEPAPNVNGFMNEVLLDDVTNVLSVEVLQDQPRLSRRELLELLSRSVKRRSGASQEEVKRKSRVKRKSDDSGLIKRDDSGLVKNVKKRSDAAIIRAINRKSLSKRKSEDKEDGLIRSVKRKSEDKEDGPIRKVKRKSEDNEDGLTRKRKSEDTGKLLKISKIEPSTPDDKKRRPSTPDVKRTRRKSAPSNSPKEPIPITQQIIIDIDRLSKRLQKILVHQKRRNT